MYHAQEGEQRVSVGDVDEKRLRRELAKVRTRLERRPHAPSWREFEPMARVLHWLGDPQAAGYFRPAADRARARGAVGGGRVGAWPSATTIAWPATIGRPRSGWSGPTGR